MSERTPSVFVDGFDWAAAARVAAHNKVAMAKRRMGPPESETDGARKCEQIGRRRQCTAKEPYPSAKAQFQRRLIAGLKASCSTHESLKTFAKSLQPTKCA